MSASGTLLDAFLAGISIHRWDVMFPFDPHVQLSPDCMAVIVERYPHRARWWDIALPAQHPPLPVRFRFTVSGVTAPSADFVITSQNEKYMEVPENVLADVTFRCHAETFVLLVYGRLSPASALSKCMLTYEGDQEWAEIFLHAYVGG
jgi:hypothetical protein